MSDRSVLVVDDEKDMVFKIKGILKNPELFLLDVQIKSYLLKGHTWEIRLEKLFKQINI